MAASAPASGSAHRRHPSGPRRRRRGLIAWCAAVAAGVLVGTGACSDLPHNSGSAAPKNSSGGHTYYVSASGDDANSGTSSKNAWKTLARADQAKYKAGDWLLLRGGDRFTGTLSLGPGEAGNPTLPTVVASYGKGGRATIAAAGTDGISVYNTAGVVIRDLVLVGDPAAYASQTGISFFTDLPGAVKLEHAVVQHVDVSSFKTAVSAGSTTTSGFRDVQVTNSVLHGNHEAGLVTYGMPYDDAAPAYSNEQVVVTGVEVYDSAGDPTARDRHTGDGIVLGSVRGGVIRSSSAHDNGTHASADSLFGPEGIWTYDSTGMLIEHNTSYRNHTGSNVDGGGFGMDVNVSASTMQYNLSFQNDGPGFLVYTSRGNTAQTGDIVRFNISSNDARKLPWDAGIEAHGTAVHDLQIYQNTVVMTSEGAQPAPALRLRKGLAGTSIRNNILITDGTAPAVVSDVGYGPDAVAMQGNNYFTGTSSTGLVSWGGNTLDALDAWRSADKQELLNGRATGLAVDPCLAGGPAPVVSGPNDAGVMVPICPAVDGKGVDLKALGVAPSVLVDYYGKPLAVPPVIGVSNPAVKK
ncbi:right-handed parallel beta-helix repeat-containing protein [Uniformispora flossi]|uniref:right-handed parallel beta-helix repeat-containing protein n=1 Tax=Uniformispora flossi TaxID=3390723 RepID=UPI003C2B81FC